MKKMLFIFTMSILCLNISACVSSRHIVVPYVRNVEKPDTPVTATLRSELETVRRVTAILEEASNRLDSGEYVSQETLNEIAVVISKFSDKRHQEREEKILFPLLKEKQGGDKKHFLGRLLMEHIIARDHIRDLSKAIKTMHQGNKAKRRVTKIANSYIKKMRKHIETEERILFPWINQVLTSEEQLMLQKKFEEAEKEDLEKGVHEKYAIIIEELEKHLNILTQWKDENVSRKRNLIPWF